MYFLSVDKSRYELVALDRSKIALYRVVSRHTGRITYHVGRIAIQPAQVHELTGVETASYEDFVSDKVFDNERDGRQGYTQKVLLAPKPTRRRRTKVTAEA